MASTIHPTVVTPPAAATANANTKLLCRLLCLVILAYSSLLPLAVLLPSSSSYFSVVSYKSHYDEYDITNTSTSTNTTTPTQVYLYPEFSRTTGDYVHILVDGVDRSTHFQRIRTLPELFQRMAPSDDDENTTQEDIVMAINYMRIRNGDEDRCKTLLTLLANITNSTRSGRRNWNRVFLRKIVVLDFSDGGWAMSKMKKCLAAITAYLTSDDASSSWTQRVLPHPSGGDDGGANKDTVVTTSLEFGCRQFYKQRKRHLTNSECREEIRTQKKNGIVPPPFTTFGAVGYPQNFAWYTPFLGNAKSTSKNGNTNTGSATGTTPPPTTPVHLLRYPVRSDMVAAMETMLQQVYGPTTINKTTTRTTTTTRATLIIDRITLPRPIDVASFSLGITNRTDRTATLRSCISTYIADHTFQNVEYYSPQNSAKTRPKTNATTIFVGELGGLGKKGRNTPQQKYMHTMLQSKIVVTAQRTAHEDHYRFLEGMVSGALVLSDPMHPFPAGLQNGTHFLVYRTFPELRQYLRYYTDAAHAHERLQIARTGYEFVMQQHRSWHVIERILVPELIN